MQSLWGMWEPACGLESLGDGAGRSRGWQLHSLNHELWLLFPGKSKPVHSLESAARPLAREARREAREEAEERRRLQTAAAPSSPPHLVADLIFWMA